MTDTSAPQSIAGYEGSVGPGRGRFISDRGCTRGHTTNRQTVTALKRGQVIIPAAAIDRVDGAR